MVGTLEADADDLEKVADFTNKTFCKHVSGDSVRFNERKTFVTPSVVHTLKWYTKTVRDKRCKLKVIYLCKYLSNFNVNTIKSSAFFPSF